MLLNTETNEPNNLPIKKPASWARDRFLGLSIIIAALATGGAWIYTAQLNIADPQAASAKIAAKLEKIVLPEKGVTLPVSWGDLGDQLVANGTIDMKKLEELFAQRGGLDEETKRLLAGTNNARLVMTKDNANTLLNLLWAFGLANKNDILEKGMMTDKRYGGDAGRFASTGGWTLSIGSPMNHYSRHAMVPLNTEQQTLVEKVSQNIYRPCCGNSTYFPDCNHGMAMLGLLELMAAQGVSEEEMYRVALQVNAFWFPENYLTIASFLKKSGIDWEDISPKGILAAEYSSAAGYQQVLKQVQPVNSVNGGSCGV